LTRLLGRVPRRAEMLYIKARLLYGRNHFSRAVGLFAQVIKEHPRHSAARGSALLLLDALNRQGQHQQLARWTKRLLANKALAKGTLLAQLRALRVQIAHRAAQKLFQAKRFAECGKAFAAASRLPGAQRTCELLFNAAVCFERAKKLRKSLALRRSLVQKRSCRSLAAQAVEQGCRHPARLRDRWWRKRCKARR